MTYVSTVLEMSGFAALIFGLYLVAPWLALVIGGPVLVFVGFALGGKR